MLKRSTDPYAAEKYAALRTIASKAGDHLAELEFFSSELRARRFWYDKPFGKGAGRFWFGIIYETASDFGRSLWRPVFLWAAFLLWGIYVSLGAITSDKELGLAEITNEKCIQGHGSLLSEAVYLSMANAMLFGFSDEERVSNAKQCLFGTGHPTGHPSGSPDYPAGVAIFQIVHGLLSALSAFLLGLAIRNNFRAR